MTFPNMIIGGAPKCGTSSLFSWLADHPQACGSSVKEPFFLMDRGNPMRRRECNFHDHGLEAYQRFFTDCAGQRLVVEATTHYLYQSTAIDIVPRLPSEPKMLFLLRKPSERIYSSFAYSKERGNVRSGLSFADFLQLVEERPGETASGWARGASAYVLPRDFEYSRYADYLCQWRKALGDERLKVLLFEDLRADPKAVLQQLCGWLGIDPAFYEDYAFAGRNLTISVRSPAIQRMARGVAAKLGSGSLKDLAKRLYYALQAKSRVEGRTAADEAALARLDEQFRPFNERLEREFGLDLSAWQEASPASATEPG
jgi:hypothetical protein